MHPYTAIYNAYGDDEIGHHLQNSYPTKSLKRQIKIQQTIWYYHWYLYIIIIIIIIVHVIGIIIVSIIYIIIGIIVDNVILSLPFVVNTIALWMASVCLFYYFFFKMIA